jgi:hypothetical protein
VRYYRGVDWADQRHAVWVVDESGTKVAGRTVPHTVEGLSEWGRELDQWRAQGIELWAAIERPDGRVGDFLLDHDLVVYPVSSGRGPGAQTPRGGLPAPDPAADPPGQPADHHAEGGRSARARNGRVDDGTGAGVPGGLPDPGGRGRPHGTPMAALGACASTERGPDPGALG